MLLQKTHIPARGINPNIRGQKLKTVTNYELAEKELSSKILNITMKIHNHYPELSKFLEEMPETIPAHKKPEITLHILNGYYRSLDVLLNTYIKENPHNPAI